ncbi:hypothetical protein [Streptomyces sp. NPDC059893]
MGGEAQGVQVCLGLEDVGQSCAAGQGAYRLAPLAQRADEGVL